MTKGRFALIKAFPMISISVNDKFVLRPAQKRVSPDAGSAVGIIAPHLS